MRVVFMGTPDFSVPTLTEIVSSGHEVVAVYTRAPKPAGRGQAHHGEVRLDTAAPPPAPERAETESDRWGALGGARLVIEIPAPDVPLADDARGDDASSDAARASGRASTRERLVGR